MWLQTCWLDAIMSAAPRQSICGWRQQYPALAEMGFRAREGPAGFRSRVKERPAFIGVGCSSNDAAGRRE
jgi:hypothetical protein